MTFLDCAQTHSETEEFSAYPALISAAPVPAAQASLSALEWSVVAMAQQETLSSIRKTGPLSAAMGVMFGGRRSPALADRRLEALRRMAVLAWHRAGAIKDDEREAFSAAGFTTGQYELVRTSIEKGRAASAARVH